MVSGTETARALVMTAPGEPLRLAAIEVDPPRLGEVRVRMAVAGICHSDLATLDGSFPAVAPMVLGHEGAGVVESVGPGVTALVAGDRVVITNSVQCGSCYQCRKGRPQLCDAAAAARRAGGLLDGTHRARYQGAGLAQLALSGTFAELTVVPALSAIRIPDSVPFTVGALISCAVLTGYGAAVNTADIEPGETVMVIGCGGVGLNIIQGARLRKAASIIAVDLDPERESWARRLGATDFRSAPDGSADWVFDVVCRAGTVAAAVAATGRGGTTVLVGVPEPGLSVELPVLGTLLADGKLVRGCWYGSCDVARDVPDVVGHYLSGELFLDELATHRVDLATAVDLVGGRTRLSGIRTVIDFADPADMADPATPSTPQEH
jgi:Zn-dependent alcohol dehydrogenase